LNCKKKLEKKIKLKNESKIKKIKIKRMRTNFLKKYQDYRSKDEIKNKLKSNKKAKNQNHKLKH